MAISTNGISTTNVNSLDSMLSSKTATKDCKTTSSFADIMNSSVNNNTKTNQDIGSRSKTDITKDLNASGDNAVSDNKVSDNTHTSKADKNENSKISDEKNDATKNDIASKETEQENVSSENLLESDLEENELINEIVLVIQNIMQILQDILGVDQNQLQDMLNQLGLEETDLLDEMNLQPLVLISQNATEVDAIMNEDITNLLKEVTEEIDAILEETEAIVEDYHSLISNPANETVVKEFVNKNVNQDIETTSLDEKNVEVPGEVVTNSDEIVDKVVSDGKPANDANADHSSDDTNSTLFDNISHAIDDAVVNEFDGIEMTEDVQEADIIRQLIDDIKANVTEKTKSLSVQLNPENLGKVQINVVQKNGAVSAQIIAENEMARHAIESSLSALKEAFENQELKVDAIEVMISNYEFFNQQEQDMNESQQNQTMKSQNGLGNISDDMDEDELTEEEKIQVSMMRAQGNQVSYLI